jgi:phage terminase large subunit
MNVEQRIVLDKFQPRWYQEEIWEAIEIQQYRKVIAILPRRAGKDITAWNLCIRQCLRKVCTVYYCLPTYGQARSCVWDAIAIDGTKFIDYIPKALIESINQQEMKIRFKNGSILKLIGGDSFNTSLVGTNPYGIVFSEFSLMSEGAEAYSFARPILAANGGWVLFLATPRGHNHMYHLYKLASELSDWHVIKMGSSQTKHISQEALDLERQQMDEGLYLQEFECSFERGIEGSFYGRNLDQLKLKNQITSVPWEPGLLTYLAMDIGVHDATTLIWWQSAASGNILRIIDCYSNTGLGLDHYAKIIKEKPYTMGKIFAPADIAVREWAGGAVQRYEKAKELGLDFTVLPQIKIRDGIENVWSHFPKFWIDKEKCRSLINALENYRREWDEKRQQYDDKPMKGWMCHYADALRYMCQAIHKTSTGLTSEEFERQRAQAIYGSRDILPRQFRRP